MRADAPQCVSVLDTCLDLARSSGARVCAPLCASTRFAQSKSMHLAVSSMKRDEPLMLLFNHCIQLVVSRSS